MKKLQSLTCKISYIILFSVLTACSTEKQTVDYEPCSVASTTASMQSDAFYEAFRTCRVQATQGDPVSQKNLAYMYYFGTPNLPKDKEKALWWLKVAADNGSATAEARLALIGEWIKLGKYGNTWQGVKVAQFNN